MVLTALNELLKLLDEKPVNERQLQEKQTQEMVLSAIKEKVFDSKMDSEQCFCEDLLSELQEKFLKSTDKKEKLQILTIIPKKVSLKYICTKFDCTMYIARKAREIKEQRGILAHNTTKVSHNKADPDVEKLVKEFYMSPEISRTTSGERDVVKVINKNGDIEELQKQLMLVNIDEAFIKFKKENPDVNIEKPHFAKLRPMQCILLGEDGSHAICVCKYHENMKFMFGAFKGLSDKEDIEAHKKLLMCTEPTTECKLLRCLNCPKDDHYSLISYTIEFFRKNGIEHISFKRWRFTDRRDTCIIQQSLEDFAIYYADQLYDFIKHEFISETQTNFVKEKKEKMTKEELIVEMDFAANFTHIAQNETQGVYCTEVKSSLHPVIFTYKRNDQIKKSSFVFISNSLEHNIQFVRAVQKDVVAHAKKTIPNLKKIVYVTDGSSSEYKNKTNFYLLSRHLEDFGLQAEWIFHATSHGKGTYDAIGGEVKRMLRRQILKSWNINNAKDAYDWLKKQYWETTKTYNIQPFYLEKEDIKKIKIPETTANVPGTRGYHYLKETKKNTVTFYECVEDENPKVIKFE